jgi:hypothetical protein
VQAHRVEPTAQVERQVLFSVLPVFLHIDL